MWYKIGIDNSTNNISYMVTNTPDQLRSQGIPIVSQEEVNIPNLLPFKKSEAENSFAFFMLKPDENV